MLREAVIGTKNQSFLGILGKMEAFVGENGQEVVENWMTLEFGNILHAHDIWLQISDEPTEISEQRPLRVVVILKPLRIF